MPIIRIGLAVLLAGAVLAGCEAQPAGPQTETYSSTQQGFSISYPGQWQKATTNFGQDPMFIPPDQTDPNVFRDNLTVHVEELPEGTTLEGLFAVKAAAGSNARPEVEYKEISRGTASLGGVPARTLMYSFKRDEQQTLTALAYFLVSGNRGYSILATAALARFPQHKPAFEEMAASFRLLSAAPAK
jgi:hypothetical protein